MVERATSLHGGAIWRTYNSRAELSREVTLLLQEALAAGLAERGRAYAALAGGLTPIPVYDRLAQAEMDWANVTLAPTDERLAQPGHAARNDLMLTRAFARGPAKEATVLSLEDEPLIAALPAFDAVLLGIGADGHFASLFPHAEGLAAAMDTQSAAPLARIVPDPLPPEAPFVRLTMTLARLINARRIVLMITGGDKLAIAQDACTPGDPLDPPLRGLFTAAHVEVHWSA
ncbi:MAG TPA: 6-phosphogluconolactonase [Caulobacterales bacterium]|jgi:6-phosphogluconolactonase|nr:6-phosphogluconolactonase [Caulobacterales bacterium]